MRSKAYYNLLTFAFCVLVASQLLQLFTPAFPWIVMEITKSLLAFAILVVETIFARKTFRTINSILFAIAAIGLVFLIQFWPFRFLIFFGALLGILTSLFVNAFTNGEKRKGKVLLLFYPLSHCIFVYYAIHRIHLFWIMDLFVAAVIALYLLMQVANLNETK